MQAVLTGGATDRVPFFPCIYVDHASHACGQQFEEALADPRQGLLWMFEAGRRYGSDAVRVMLTPPHTWFREKEVRRNGDRLVQVDRRTGAIEGRFDVAGGGALIPARAPEPIRTIEAAEAIRFPSAEQLLETGCLDAARAITRRAHDEGRFVVGMAGGQTLNFLCRHIGDSQNALLTLIDEPDLARTILAKGTDASIEVGRAFAEIGVDCLYIGDSWASGSVISPRIYAGFCTPCYRRAADAAHARGLLVYKHCCGDYNPLLDAVKHDHLDGIEGIDPTSGMSVARTRASLGDRLCLIGGVSCLTLLHGTPEQVEAEARACIGAGGPRYVLGSACAVPRRTPPENMHALAQAALATASEST
jgi:uroporphyrinogen-III decarboxylase